MPEGRRDPPTVRPYIYNNLPAAISQLCYLLDARRVKSILLHESEWTSYYTSESAAYECMILHECNKPFIIRTMTLITIVFFNNDYSLNKTREIRE